MTDERRGRRADIDGTSDVSTRHLMGLTRRAEPAASERRITEPHKIILGRVSRHGDHPFVLQKNN